jgi:hypothetical protein
MSIDDRGSYEVRIDPICLTLGCVALFAAGWAFSPATVDDAYISFRYAKNLADGLGLVFNPGERVEGYTNLLWTLLLSLPIRLGLDPELSARALGWLSTVAAAWVLWSHLARLQLVGRGAAMLLLLSSPALALWSGAGLETTLFLFLWLTSRVCISREADGRSQAVTGLTLLGLVLCRPDGVIPALVGVWACWKRDRMNSEHAPKPEEGSDPLRRQKWIIPGLVGIGGGIFALWKWRYYGSLLPCSYYAKRVPPALALTHGIEDLLRFVKVHPWSLLALIPPLARIGRVGPRKLDGSRVQAQETTWLLRLARVDCVAFVAYFLWVGGDVMLFCRFYVPLLPPLALLAAVSLGRVRSRPARHGIVLAGAVWSFLQGFVGDQPMFVVKSDRITRIGLVVGRFLSGNLPSDSVIAVNAAGALPYAAGVRAIDMLGINDVHIAKHDPPPQSLLNSGHARGDGRYVLDQRPDVILLGNSAGSPTPLYFSDADLGRDPRFKENYQLLTVSFGRLQTLTGAGGGSDPDTASLRTLVATRGLRASRTDPDLGLEEVPSDWGPLHLRRYYTTDFNVYLFVRRDRHQALVTALVRR